MSYSRAIWELRKNSWCQRPPPSLGEGESLGLGLGVGSLRLPSNCTVSLS